MEITGLLDARKRVLVAPGSSPQLSLMKLPLKARLRGPDHELIRTSSVFPQHISLRGSNMRGSQTGNLDQELVSVKTLSKMIDVSERTIWDWDFQTSLDVE